MDETPRRELVLPKEFYVVLGVAAGAYLLYALSSVLTPLLLAFSIAYVLNPLISRLQAWKVPRPAGIALVLLSALGAVVALVALVVPGIASDIASVAIELPRKLSAMLASAEPWLTARGVRVPHTTTEWVQRLGANADKLATSMLAPASGFLSGLLAGVFTMAGSMAAVLVVPVLSVYFLNDFDRITAGIGNLAPRRYRRLVTEYAKQIDAALSPFLTGQVFIMLIMGLLYGIAYAILGVRLALPIGIVAGLLSFIPYLGSATALVSGLAMSLLGGIHPGQLLGVLIAYVIIQMLEGFVIAPRIMGKSVGLKEMWVLIAVFVGGQIFGFLGVLLAVPAAAVAKVFLSRAVDIYHESDLYLEGPASMRSIPPAEPLNTAPPPGATSAPIIASRPRVSSAPPSPSPTPIPPRTSVSKTPLAGSVVPPPKKPNPAQDD
ncbi:MAG TPA: AI-2E family transporter [Polyangiaceae bacterium]